MLHIPKSLNSLDLLFLWVFMCTTCINTNLRVPLTARRLTINFERNLQIVILSETDVSATLMFTSTFAIYDTLMKRPPEFFRIICVCVCVCVHV